MLICRSSHLLSKEVKQKIALFTNVLTENVITGSDAEWIYEIPLLLAKEGVHKGILKKLTLPQKNSKTPRLAKNCPKIQSQKKRNIYRYSRQILKITRCLQKPF